MKIIKTWFTSEGTSLFINCMLEEPVCDEKATRGNETQFFRVKFAISLSPSLFQDPEVYAREIFISKLIVQNEGTVFKATEEVATGRVCKLEEDN